ncbi:putative mitochondrial carrier domain superfamily [Helianthus anomalus]
MLHTRWILYGPAFQHRNVIYYRGISHALRTISREEGIFSLYKGLGACLLVSFPYANGFLYLKYYSTDRILFTWCWSESSN